MNDLNRPRYGTDNASFEAAGGEAGIRSLVEAFYDRMGLDPRFARIYAMHPADISTSRDKLARFFCGWLGGPRLYQEKYGQIGIPSAHAHLPIKEAERDQWLLCMEEAIADQPFEADFQRYLLAQLTVPAQAIYRRCTENPIGDS